MVKSAKTSSITLRQLIFWAAVFALVASLSIFILEKSQVTNVYTKPANTEQQPIQDGPTNIIDYPINNSTDITLPPNKDSGTDKPIASETLTGIINYKSVISDVLSIRVTLYQNINTGSCTLKLTRALDSKQVIKNANVIANPSSATCGGFDIPLAELGSGKWSIVIDIASGDKTGTITDEVST